MCYSKACFKHDITIPKRDWFVGDKALYSDKRSKRLPLVFIAPIYVPFQNQLVKLETRNNYYRVEGNYRNAIRNNMAINISQFERNLEAIQFGQESQSTYLTPPNPKLLFATQALNVANTYYSLQFQKQNAGLMTGSEKTDQTDSVGNVTQKTYYDI